MDIAYDHIVEESLPKEDEIASSSSQSNNQANQQNSLNSEFQEAYKAFSSSPWGARIGGFFGNVVKQGETVYKEASKEVVELGQDATKGLTDLRASLINRTRAISLSTGQQPQPAAAAAAGATGSEKEATPVETDKGMTSDEALKESETVLSRLRLEAAKRLKDLQKAEDAADEALLRFGGNLRNFLKDAISIAPPSGDSQDTRGEVLFESKDAQGKRVIHTSRFDAQLHVIHTTTENFIKDPTGAEYEAWSKGFDIEKKNGRHCW